MLLYTSESCSLFVLLKHITRIRPMTEHIPMMTTTATMIVASISIFSSVLGSVSGSLLRSVLGSVTVTLVESVLASVLASVLLVLVGEPIILYLICAGGNTYYYTGIKMHILSGIHGVFGSSSQLTAR